MLREFYPNIFSGLEQPNQAGQNSTRRYFLVTSGQAGGELEEWQPQQMAKLWQAIYLDKLLLLANPLPGHKGQTVESAVTFISPGLQRAPTDCILLKSAMMICHKCTTTAHYDQCHMWHVTCHISCVTCHMSLVTCNIFFLLFFFFYFGQHSEASQWRVCYQRGLPRLA